MDTISNWRLLGVTPVETITSKNEPWWLKDAEILWTFGGKGTENFYTAWRRLFGRKYENERLVEQYKVDAAKTSYYLVESGYIRMLSPTGGAILKVHYKDGHRHAGAASS